MRELNFEEIIDSATEYKAFQEWKEKIEFMQKHFGPLSDSIVFEGDSVYDDENYNDQTVMMTAHDKYANVLPLLDDGKPFLDEDYQYDRYHDLLDSIPYKDGENIFKIKEPPKLTYSRLFVD